MNRIEIFLPKMIPAQRDIVSNARRFNVGCIGRRFGKTELGSRLVAKTALVQQQPVAWFAPSYKIMDDAWRRIKQMLFPAIRSKDETSKRLDLYGGGSIEFWSISDEDAGRSRRYARAIIDEAALAPKLQSVWENAIAPTLTDLSGDAWFFSTPKGHNFFHELAQRHETNSLWSFSRYPTSANPRIPSEEIEEMRRNLPERVFAQEYLAEFIDDSGVVFRNITACVCVDAYQPVGRPVYVIGVDWGKSEDFTALTVMDAIQRRVVMQDVFNRIDYQFQLGRLKALFDRFPVSSIVAETNAMGEPLIDQLRAEGLPVRGVTTTATSKSAMIEALSLAFERMEIVIPPDQELINELLRFDMRRLPSGAMSYGAPPGAHDDRVMSLALAYSDIASRWSAPQSFESHLHGAW